MVALDLMPPLRALSWGCCLCESRDCTLLDPPSLSSDHSRPDPMMSFNESKSRWRIIPFLSRSDALHHHIFQDRYKVYLNSISFVARRIASLELWRSKVSREDKMNDQLLVWALWLLPACLNITLSELHLWIRSFKVTLYVVSRSDHTTIGCAVGAHAECLAITQI